MAGSVELPALLAKIKIDDKEYKAGIGNVQTALDKLEQKMRSTFSSMENIGKKAAIPFAALSAAIGGVAKAAGDLETATIRLSAAVQGDTKELEFFTQAVKKVRAGSEETLTTITNVMARAKLLGTELGLSNDQIAELTLISENLSTIWGGDMQTALEGLMYGMAGMTRGLKQYGIFADDVRLKERLRAQGLNDDLSLLSATEKSQLIYETILESVAGQLTLANAAGASFNTQIARVKNAFIDLSAAVGKNFIGDFTKSITSFADKIIAISQSPALTELIARLLKIGVVLTGVGVAIGIIGKLGNISLSLLHAGFTMLTNPILITVAAIALLLANLDKIRVAWDTANIENIGEYWNQLVTSLSTGDFSGAINAGMKIVFAPIKWLWEGIEEAYTSLAGIIGEDIRTSVDALKAAIDKGNYFEALGFALGVVANAVWQGIEWGMATAALISENIGKEWKTQKAIIENEWNTGSKASAAIAAVVFATWNGIKWTGKQFEEAGKTLSAVIDEDWNTQVTAVKALWENGDKLAATIVAIATGTWQGLKWSWKQAEGAYNTISEVINADWETQKAAIQGEWDKGNYISAVITAAVTGTWQGLKWAWKQAIGAYNTISSVINADWETQKKAIGLAWAGGDYVSAIITAAVTGTWQGLKWAWGQAKKTYETLSAVLGEDWETQKAAIGTLWTSGDYLTAGIVAVATATWGGLKWAWGVGETAYQSLSKVLGEDWEAQKAEVVRLWNGEKKIEAGLVAFVSAVWSGIRWVGEQFAIAGATLSSVIGEDLNTQLAEVKNLWGNKEFLAASIVAVASVTWQGLRWIGAQFVEAGTTLTSVINADWETQKAAVAVLWEGKNLIAATIVAGVTGTWQGIKWMFGAVELTAKTLSDVILEDVETQKKAISELWGSGQYIEAAIVAGVTGTWQGIKWAWGAAKTIYTSIVEMLNLDWEEQKKAIGTLWGEGKYIEAAITAVVVGRWNGLKWAWGVATTTFATLADVINADWETQKAAIGSLWAAGEIVPALLVATVTGTWNGIKWISGQTKLAIDSIAAGVQVDWEEQKKIAAGLWAGKDFVAATISAIVFATFQGVKWIVGAIGNVGALVQKAFEESTLKTDIDAFKAQLGASGFSVETIEAAIDVIVGIGKIVVNVVANLWETVKNKIAVAIGLAENEETAKDVGSFDVLARVIVNIGNLAVFAVTYALDIVDNIIKAISNTIREDVFGGESGELDQPVNIGDISIILAGVLRFASAGFSFAKDFFTSMNAAVANAVKNLREENQKISIGIGVTFDVENEILTTEIHAFAGKVWEFFKSGFLLVANVGELVAEAFRNALINFTGSPEIANIVTKISESLVFVVSLKLAADALSGVMATLSATLGLSKGAGGYILPVLITFGLSFLGDSVSKPMQEVKELKENLSTAIGANLFVPESFAREMSDFQKRLFAIMQYQGEPNFLTGIAERLLELSGESGFFAELEAGFDAALIYAYDFLERLGSMINSWVKDKIRNIPGIGEILVGKNPETTIAAINAIEKIVSTGDKSQIAAIGELAASGAKIEEITAAAEAITNLTIPTDLNRELNNALNSTTELYEQMEIISKTLFGMTVEQLADALGENAIEVINRLEEYLRNEVFRDVYTLKIDADVTSIVAKLKALNIKNLPEIKLSGKRFGGYTGAYPEDQVAGVVHGGEWVAPAWMIKKFPELFETLETARFRGYQAGGYVGSAKGIVSGAGSAIGTSLDTLKNVVDYISDTFLKIIDNLQGVLGEETAVQLRTLVEGMKKYVGEMPGLYKEGLQQIDALSNELSSMGDDFKETNTAMKTAANELSNAANAIQEQAASLGVGVTDIESAVRSAFSANTYDEFVSNFSQSLEEMTKQALINAFLSSEVAKASMEKLSSLFVAAVKDGTISSEELSGIKAAEQELQGLMKNTWDILAGLGYVNKPEAAETTQAQQETAFTKFQNYLLEQAKKLLDTIKNFIVNPLKEGINRVLSPAFERLQEPLYRLGVMLGEILLPVVEALTPVFEALAIGMAYVINVIIGVANTVISLINLIPSVNIPAMNYIDIAKLKEGFENTEESGYSSGSTTAGWNQPITNNFTITFTGNTVLDTDDKSLEVLSDRLISYWKDKGVKVFA